MLFAANRPQKESYNQKIMRQNNDKLLIVGCKKKEMWAQKGVYEKYAPHMLSLCMRYFPDRVEAEDVLQEGFIKVFQRIEQYEGIGEFGAWMRKIFVNTALKHLSNMKKNPVFQSDEATSEIATQEFEYADLKAVSADELMQIIAKLPKKSRLVFNLYAIEGYEYDELAEILHVSQSNLRALVSRSRTFLQAEIMKILNKK